MLASDESIGQAKLMVATKQNEWGATRVSHTPEGQIARPLVPFFLHTVLRGLYPPFSAFFYVILDHYQIQVLHL